MNIPKTRFKQVLELIELAERSNQYPDTNFLQWYSHIKFLFDRGQIIRVLVDGRVYASLEFIRCNREDLNGRELPDKPVSRGEVLYFPLAVSKVPGLLKKMYRKAVSMNPDCKFIAFHRKIDKNEDKLFIIEISTHF